MRSELQEIRQEVREHAEDDAKQFRALRRADKALAADVEASGAHAPVDPEAVKVVEGERTKRWQIAAGVAAAAITLAGAVLAGRASAPPPPPAVPTVAK